jgi:hypothetical protein
MSDPKVKQANELATSHFHSMSRAVYEQRVREMSALSSVASASNGGAGLRWGGGGWVTGTFVGIVALVNFIGLF